MEDEIKELTDQYGKVVHMNKILRTNLTRVKKNIQQYNGDLLIIVDGEEGSGKSTITNQMARFLDPNFTEKQIAYSSLEAIKMHSTNKDWTSIVLDESKEDLDLSLIHI